MDANTRETLLTLASQNNVVPYDTLMQALHVDNVRRLEDIVIDAIYRGVIQGRLNPKERKLCITDWAGREVQDADIPYMAATLDSWLERCTGFVDSMSVAVNKSNQDIATHREREHAIEEEVEKMRKNAQSGKGGASEFAGADSAKAQKRHKGSLRTKRNN
ncbi:COP9 signalosome complex subunit 7A [Aphelenchoides avenae]|nr:COP9 signalosome complex subunit 7A [Aphelenchus avenae]